MDAAATRMEVPAGAAADTPPGADYYLHERYLDDGAGSPLLAWYYRFKPAIPRSLQLQMRRVYARRQAGRTFPAWPIEPILLERRDDELRSRISASSSDRVPILWFWPDRRRFACVLTHDVEGPAGIENIHRVLELEQRYGFVSSWNFCAEWYRIPPGTFETLRAAGCEIGLHGIKHDGKLFASRAEFEANLPKVHAYMQRWGALGFRSPATHRCADWTYELKCLYDSSFPDTDPFEPQAGGCCWIFPFMFGDVVELPITLVQDHTLIDILGQRSIDLWARKCDWIIRNHGLINVITHPDYLTSPERLRMYEQLLQLLASHTDGWRALPFEVAEWWRLRGQLQCVQTLDGFRVIGDPSGRAAPAFAVDTDGKIRFQP
jgi:peptidoglycan/xylan/chitin deacetylase (PgdA/CDA1 family)